MEAAEGCACFTQSWSAAPDTEMVMEEKLKSRWEIRARKRATTQQEVAMTTSMRGCSADMQNREYFCVFSDHFHVQLLIVLRLHLPMSPLLF